MMTSEEVARHLRRAVAHAPAHPRAHGPGQAHGVSQQVAARRRDG
ncbi:MAG: hypothetical protein WKG07_05310 [Hymenobacter sp.]